MKVVCCPNCRYFKVKSKRTKNYKTKKNIIKSYHYHLLIWCCLWRQIFLCIFLWKLQKIPELYPMPECGNPPQTDSFLRSLVDSPRNLKKLSAGRKSPHQDIRRNSCTLHSGSYVCYYSLTADSRLFELALVWTSRLFEPFFIPRGYSLTSSTKNPSVIRTFSCSNFRLSNRFLNPRDQ